MKCLSVRQPWASMIALGVKTIEVRSRRTHYRGPLAIHACGRANDCIGDFALPVGAVLAVVELIDCRPFEPADAEAAMVDYAPGLWAWVLDSPTEIEPIPAKGRLGIFDIDIDPQPFDTSEWPDHVSAFNRRLIFDHSTNCS